MWRLGSGITWSFSCRRTLVTRASTPSPYAQGGATALGTLQGELAQAAGAGALACFLVDHVVQKEFVCLDNITAEENPQACGSWFVYLSVAGIEVYASWRLESLRRNASVECLQTAIAR